MVIVTQENINGREFVVHRSDAYMMIENEKGERYSEAWDIPEANHTYTETDEPINSGEDEELDIEAQYAEAGRIVLGDA